MTFNSIPKNILYLGNNNFKKHKRGVENVILFQSKSNIAGNCYYIFWDNITSVSHYENILCISIKKNIFWPIILNLVLFKLKFKKNKILIHSHNPLMTLFSFFKTNLFSVHDPLHYLAKSNSYKFPLFYRIIEMIVYRRTVNVHFISNYSKSVSLLPSKIPNKVIYNTSFLESRINIPIDLNFNSNQNLNILVVRSIEERARIDLIIEIAKYLKNTEIYFTIVGTGPLYNHFKDYIKENRLNNIKMIGYVNDINLINHYKSCDLVLVPAEYGEGFGLPIIEGYLFNKPVIASNKCAIPEIIFSLNNLFENNPESVISKINEIKKQKKVNFREYYLNNFSNNIILQQLDSLYNNIY
jgi:glycosyltransferase involved in cell wall biosynthesis